MTLIPNYLVTGVLATVMGLVVATWTTTSIGRRDGGLILILLSVPMLFVGGGLMPPIPGVIAGIVFYMNRSPDMRASRTAVSNTSSRKASREGQRK